MTDEQIELCLQRLSTGKASDVINFSYADALAYIERLKADNEALRARLERAVELPCKVGDTVYYLQTYCDYKGETVKHCSKKSVRLCASATRSQKGGRSRTGYM